MIDFFFKKRRKNSLKNEIFLTLCLNWSFFPIEMRTLIVQICQISLKFKCHFVEVFFLNVKKEKKNHERNIFFFHFWNLNDREEKKI